MYVVIGHYLLPILSHRSLNMQPTRSMRSLTRSGGAYLSLWREVEAEPRVWVQDWLHNKILYQKQKQGLHKVKKKKKPPKTDRKFRIFWFGLHIGGWLWTCNYVQSFKIFVYFISCVCVFAWGCICTIHMYESILVRRDIESFITGVIDGWIATVWMLEIESLLALNWNSMCS